MSAVITVATFRELQDTAGADFVAELVDTFFEEAPGMLAALRTAQASGDADAYRRAAHSLKSNSLTFGATRLAAMARELELGAADAVGPQQRGDLAALGREYDEVAAALERLKND
jgi:HPt (histidine-containing phosphotransfer) domain-containing protein